MRHAHRLFVTTLLTPVFLFGTVMLNVGVARGWQVEALPHEGTIGSDLLDAQADPVVAERVGWQISVHADADGPLVNPMVRIQDTVFNLRGSLQPGQAITVRGDGQVTLPDGWSAAEALTPVQLDAGKEASVKVTASGSSPVIDFRLLRGNEIGWRFPDEGFENASRWRDVVENQGATMAITREEAYRGRASLKYHGSAYESMAIAKSPYLPLTPSDLGLDRGIAVMAISLKIKAENVTWSDEISRHGGGPRVSLRFYDKDRQYLYQGVVTNANGANELIQGTTDGWVTMRGTYKRFRSDMPIAYVRLYIAGYGKGTLYFDDIQMQRISTLMQEDQRTFVFIEPMPKPVHEKPQVTNADTQAGFALFRHDPLIHMLQNFRPAQADVIDPASQSLEIAAARGEVASATFGVYGVAETSQAVTIQTDGGDLPANWITMHRVGRWPQVTNNLGTNAKMVPELLEPFDSLAIDPDANQQVWLTIRVPADAHAGTYRTTLKIKGERGQQSLPVVVQVLPFVLRENNTVWQEMFYHYTSRIFPQPMPRHILLAEMQDMKDHGINMVHTQALPYVRKAADGSIRFDYTRFNELFEAFHATGMHEWTPISLYWAHFDAALTKETGLTWGDPGFEELYIRGVDGLVEHVKKAGFTGLLLRVEDEPGNFPSLREEVENTLHALAKSKATSYVNTGGVDEWVVKVLPLIDVTRMYALTSQFKQSMLENGNTYVDSAVSFRESEIANQRMSGGLGAYETLQQGGRGVSWYTYRVGTAADLTNSLIGLRGQPAFTVYPDPQTLLPRPTLQWETVRAAINDLRYLLTMDLALEEARTQGRVTNELDQKAQAVREKVAKLARVDSTIKRANAARMTHADYQTIRQEVSQIIIQAMGESR